MEKAYFEMQWPREKLFMSCFAHEIMNYRYHWHPYKYELNILLRGSQEFCRGTETFLLEENDVIVISPGSGHASFAPQANTQALVLHFSASAFKPFIEKNALYDFPSCCSVLNRNNSGYKRIRFYASQIYLAAQMEKENPYANLTAKASLELLLVSLCTLFQPQTIKSGSEEDSERQETVHRLLNYIEQHYSEKITLEDLAQHSQYNRTYISTLFKNTVGINFHEYLTRFRFQQALIDLSSSKKSLTDVALDNGFSDLKSFNAKFRETLHRTPAEYRAALNPNRVLPANKRNLISCTNPFLNQKLHEYTLFPDIT